jgi:hypothetical protein
MTVVDATTEERAEAVRAFDAAYGRMDRTLWTLSRAGRPWLLRGEESPILDELVWALKSWWGGAGRPVGDQARDGRGARQSRLGAGVL